MLNIKWIKDILHDESTNKVEVLMGSMYKSGEITTGWYVLVAKFLGKVSETKVTIIDVFPTPSTIIINEFLPSPRKSTLI